MKDSLMRFWIVLSWVFALAAIPPAGHAATYYVSSSDGNDANNGLSEGTAFQTIARVNTLTLGSGDQVLFRCGDIWQGEMLYLVESGASGNPLVYGSYPDRACADKPVISGSLPINGWSIYSGNIYVADLSSGANSGSFPNGINQLFRNGSREMMGRWPNIDASRGGYSFVDAQPAANRITDAQLPDGNWNGGAIHLMGMRWYILNREITGTSGTTLTLDANAECWGSCADNGGWGYFINNHLNTLDQDGEWHYDANTNQVYLYSNSGTPTNVEGSVVLYTDERNWGGITLGRDLNEEIAYVTIDNFTVKNWFWHGISTPTNYSHYELHDVIIRNTQIQDVDSTGIRLGAWVYDAQDGRQSNWRGGYNLQIENNVIDGANQFGIDLYSRNSQFIGNSIQNIALLENVNKSGIGCGYTSGGGGCTESGDGIRVKISIANDTGNTNLIQQNRLIKTGYNGVDIFGFGNTLRQNYIQEACYTKADCGAVRTFGGSSFANTSAYDIRLEQNIIIDPVGNVDGANNTYNQENFAFGLYIDHYSSNVTTIDNTLIRVPSTALLYQDSSGNVIGNTIYDASRNYGRAAVSVGDTSQIGNFTGNILYSIGSNARTLNVATANVLSSSDDNTFFHPFREEQIYAAGGRTFEGWQAYSGKDGNSRKHWFSLNAGETPRSVVFYNDTTSTQTFDLGAGNYQDLSGNVMSATLSLEPFTSQVLIGTLSESGDVTLYGSTGTVIDKNKTSIWHSIAFSENFGDAPVFVADIQTNQGGETAELRMQNLTGSAVEIKLEEDKSVDNENNHLAENVGYLALTPGPIENAAGETIGETGSLEARTTENNDWESLTFQRSYTNPVVRMQMVTFGGAAPSHVRLRNVSGSGLEFQIEEWDHDDQFHGWETINYVVVEVGDHTLPNNTRLVAGTVDISADGSGLFTKMLFSPVFADTPIVFSQSQSYNDPAALVTRQKDLRANRVKIRLVEEEAADQVHGSETVGYIAIGALAAGDELLGVELYPDELAPSVLDMGLDVFEKMSFDLLENPAVVEQKGAAESYSPRSSGKAAEQKIPEPSMLVLLVSGLFGLSGLWRKLRRK